MKYHITNLYNFNPNDTLATKQHRFTNVARSLGFYEMGIFSYPVETDTLSELGKRLDGIIAALEPEDVVFIQLPTRNGVIYENRLFNKIKQYSNTKIVLLLHDLTMISESTEDEKEQYFSMFRQADMVVAPSLTSRALLQTHGVSELLFMDNFDLPGDSNAFLLKKLFLDSIAKIVSTQRTTLQAHVQSDPNEIHICFGLYDKKGTYSIWVGVAMQSLIEHTSSKLCFHILHDQTLNESNKAKLLQVAENGGHRVLFHFLSQNLFDSFKEQLRNYTIGAMFRVMLPEILPDLPKIIYLDADILANRDIKELWDIDITNYCLAAVPDLGVVSGAVKPVPVKRGEVSPDRYFNSGVICMNLDAIRQKGNMREDIIKYLLHAEESDLPDQDALNAIYCNETLLIDASWNRFARMVRPQKETHPAKCIYHYVGTVCLLYTLSPMDFLYYETVSHTPWGTEECRRIRKASLERTTTRIRLLEKILTKVSSGNVKKIFYGEESPSMKHMYQLLSLKEGDYRILSSPDTSSACVLPCKDFSTIATEPQGNFILLVLPDADNWNAIATLNRLGYVNEEDYFIIPEILPPDRGGYV